MNTRVGPARTMQVNPLLRDSPQNIYNFALDCRFVRLNLPAVKIRSVVGNGEFEISHSKAGESPKLQRAHKSAAGLYSRTSFAAKRTIFRLVASNGQIEQCLRLDRKLNLAAAAVNQPTATNPPPAPSFPPLH